MKAPIVIYHANCWDGFCAAWIADRALGDVEYGRPEMFPAYYGASPPDVTGRDVYILDFSYPRAVMLDVIGRADRVVVLDHHKTAEAELSGIEGAVITFDMQKSGARLTWEFFSGDAPAPWLVDYTEDRDLWRHALPNSQEVNAALRSYPLDFDLWTRNFSGAGPAPLSLVQEGAAIRRAEKAIVDSHVRNAREVEMDGYRILSVNATVLFSEIAGELAKARPFGACYFDRQDGKRQWSLRSTADGVDVSAIAKAHGGGGHRQAAGYEVAL